ncbi:hypothetical protein NL676_023851 [Syzygium grande]|nr:hypothetical protein NL676_023851 [Syzygium grande]
MWSEILTEEGVKVAQCRIKRAAKSVATGVRKQQDRGGGVTALTQEQQLVVRRCSNRRQHDTGGSSSDGDSRRSTGSGLGGSRASTSVR